MPNNSLKNCRVLVTGGGKGIGAEIVLAFASLGADVAIHYNRNEAKAKKTAKQVLDLGQKTAIVRAEITNIAEIESAVHEAADCLSGIDLLVNNAGVFYKTPLLETTDEEWNGLLNINLRAPYFFAKFAVPFLKKASPGRIISIADTYGNSPAAGFVPYGVSKAGIIAMTKGLAKELAPSVLVNCVCPGVIFFERGREGKNAINASLLKRPVKIEDVVNTVLFLATNTSMTGQAIFVDGGKNV